MRHSDAPRVPASLQAVDLLDLSRIQGFLSPPQWIFRRRIIGASDHGIPQSKARLLAPQAGAGDTRRSGIDSSRSTSLPSRDGPRDVHEGNISQATRARRVSRCNVSSSPRLRRNAAARFDDARELIDAPPARSGRRAGDTGAARETASRSPSEGGFDRDPAFQHSGLCDDDPQELNCGPCWRSRRLTQRTSSHDRSVLRPSSHA